MPARPLHALLLPPGPQLVAAVRDALDGGPAVLPLDPAAPRPTTDRLLAELRPHTLVTADGPVALPDPAPIGAAIAAVVVTAGSTGLPKGVELSATALRHSAAATLHRLQAPDGARWACCLPTHHVAGLQVLVRSVLAGTAPVFLADPSARTLAALDAAYLAVVPTQLRRLVDADADLARFAAILVGGAAAPPGLLARARSRGGRVVTTYGMTETCGGCVYDGVPLDGVGVRLGDDDRIRLGGPVLASAYRLRPDATRRAFADGWFTTDDLGRWAPDGRLVVLGRADDMINTGGEKVSPDEVAALLVEHPAIAEVAVVGRPDPEWGQRVVAVVVPRVSTASPTLAMLRAYFAEQAPAFLAPRELILLDALPLLPSGKVDRAALQRSLADQR